MVKHVKYCSIILNGLYDTHYFKIQVFSITNHYTSNVQYKNECSIYLIFNVYDLIYVWMFLAISIYVTKSLTSFAYFLLRNCIEYGPTYGYISINPIYKTIFLLFELPRYVFSNCICKSLKTLYLFLQNGRGGK